jgi:hypothetical protein
MTIDKDTATVESKTLPQPQSTELSPERSLPETKKKPLKRRIREILWDSFDRTPEERWFIHKIDFFILTWASLSYFSKNLNTNNISKSIQTYPALQELMSATLTRHRQCLCLWNERGPQNCWKRVSDAHDYVDDVSFYCGCGLCNDGIN